jgi:uncharacterized protein YukE
MGVLFMKIYVKPEILEKSAKNMTDISDEVEEKINCIKKEIENVNTNWEGVMNSATMDTFNDLVENVLSQLPKTIVGLADYMKTISDTFVLTDEELGNANKGEA